MFQIPGAPELLILVIVVAFVFFAILTFGGLAFAIYLGYRFLTDEESEVE